MTESARPADALLTEHFRYTPLSLIDEIINAVNTIIYRALEAIENGLFSIPPATLGFGRRTSAGSADRDADADADADGNVNVEREGEGEGEGEGEKEEKFQDEIENGVHRLETLLEATVDKTFDRFEIFTLRNILTVPDDLTGWMRLAHYENLILPAPASAPTPESILQLRRKLQATKSLNLALRSTHTRNAALLASLHALLDPPSSSSSSPSSHPSLAFLNPSASASASASSEHQLTTQAATVVAQLPALRALLADLRPRLDTLRAAAAGERDGDGDRDRDSKREERRMYIESRVRKVVVGDGGAEMNLDGDGGGGGGGARVAESEMKGLETVLRELQGGNAS